MRVPDAVLLAIIAFSAFYYLLTTVLLWRWRKRQNRPEGAGQPFPAVTLLRPVKRGVPGLADKLARLVAAARPGDQILVGVEDAESFAIARGIPGLEIVRCSPGQWQNPKINKLAQMSPRAQHERWIISDSESLISREFLDELRADWRQGDVVTSGYCFVGARQLAERLDHGAALLSLWPGLMLAPRRFTLGACTGLQQADLEAIGGWDALGDFLAEDSRMGVLFTQANRRIIFSRAVLVLEGDRLSLADYWRHQLRIALTYRVSAPAGYFGMALTHGVTAALLLILTTEGALWAWLLAAAMWFWRSATALLNARALGFPARQLLLVTLLHSVTESVCWLASWISTAVYWNGRWLQISRAGKIVTAPEPAFSLPGNEPPFGEAIAEALLAAPTLPRRAHEPSPANDGVRSPHISYPAGLRRSG